MFQREEEIQSILKGLLIKYYSHIDIGRGRGFEERCSLGFVKKCFGVMGNLERRNVSKGEWLFGERSDLRRMSRWEEE